MSAITIWMFGAVILMTLVITYWAAKRTKTTGEFYAAGRSLTASQNGLALAGDWCSAAAFLGFTGLTALYGMDGALYAVGPLVAFCTAILLFAEPLRNAGKFTLGDIVRCRMESRTALIMTAIGVIVVNLAYLVPQMAGAGVLIKLLLGLPYNLAVAFVGVAMIVYVAFGGMLATTWVQIVKAVLLMTAGLVVLVLCLKAVGFNPVEYFNLAEREHGPKFLQAGNYLKNPFDQVSLGLSYICGIIGLPHVMTRFYTVPDAKTARRSVIWVMFLAGAFFIATAIFGLAAAHFIGPEAIRAADKGGNLAMPLLAQYLGGGANTLGGDMTLGFVSAVAVATILATVAGLTLATSGAVAHDIYVNAIKGGHVEERFQVRVARISVLCVGAFATILGIAAQGVNVAVLVILGFSIAASANFPVVALSLFWRRFNVGGVVGAVVVGLVSSVTLALIGPAFLGPHALWPLVVPTIVTMPLGFLGAVIGSLMISQNPQDDKNFEEISVRAHTGLGAEI
ncbi:MULTISPECIES: solute symporter family protein [Afipia]|uniref:Acetate transporter ActP n=2 Tax=Afipia felis TaxID=1035 RepID=A0A380W4B1_AFIFE|nr:MULTISPECIES: cation acetate symporter [Afipia]EFI53289.1 SSS sodium solute transporter superfamily [Afipia sp. 1NLS2]EKS30522.1 solute:sodium symporter (SSS) family transporter [Afipia felis ATCC 53690]SUU75267.1 Acetate transporter ActP [Afipia felis]SUU83333.1 Acetate transporter ActP [Afipia felis]